MNDVAVTVERIAPGFLNAVVLKVEVKENNTITFVRTFNCLENDRLEFSKILESLGIRNSD
jgi:hypothetical protein